MKKQLLAIAAAVGAITLGASAQATMVAGWDFSQYLGDGTYVVDDGSLFEFVDTLDANYSSLAPNGLGPAAAPYGRMYVNGQFGSTAQPVGSGEETFLPSAALPGGSLSSNLNAPVTDGFLNPFDSLNELIFFGQVNAVPLAMTALGAANVTFAATPTLPGSEWIVSFGARTQNLTNTLIVEASADGASFSQIASVPLTTTDTAYEFALNLGATPIQSAFVRFVFASQGADAPVIDNVAINATLVPEPGTALLLLSGLAGLTAHGRRRRA